MEIGDKLRDLRKQKKKTIKEVAKELGVGYGSVAEWEKDLVEPRKDARRKLCAYYNLTEEELLGYAHTNELDVRKVPQMESIRVKLQAGCSVFTIRGLSGEHEIEIRPI